MKLEVMEMSWQGDWPVQHSQRRQPRHLLLTLCRMHRVKVAEWCSLRVSPLSHLVAEPVASMRRIGKCC
jgi:hypothetical protein